MLEYFGRTEEECWILLLVYVYGSGGFYYHCTFIDYSYNVSGCILIEAFLVPFTFQGFTFQGHCKEYVWKNA